MDAMKILAIDPAVTRLGYAVIEYDQVHGAFDIKAWGVYKPQGRYGHEKIGSAITFIAALGVEHDPEILALEQPMGGLARFKPAPALDLLVGDLKSWGKNCGFTVRAFNPSTVRKYFVPKTAGLKGGERKRHMQNGVVRKFGLEDWRSEISDGYDAIAIGWCWIAETYKAQAAMI